MKRPRVSDDDLVLEFCDVFRASGSLRSACLAVANLAKRTRRPISRVFHPAVVETARYYGMTVAELLGDDLHREASEPRQVAMWVARQGGISWPKLGLAFDRDAQVVRYGCKRVERNPELLADGREILARVGVSTARVLAVLERREAA